MALIHVKVISDAICPFCYMGMKRLDKAMDLYKKTVPGAANDRFAVSWQPFYLDPSGPAVGVPAVERMAQKFGADRAPAMIERVRAMGAAEGIDYTYQGKVGSTRDAHRLVQLAKEKEKEKDSNADTTLQNTLMASLFRSFFEEGGDITSHDMLVAAAERAGLDGAEARAWLASDSGGAAVDTEVNEAYARGIHGVPHFIINGRVEVGGAQDVQTFVNKLVQARET